MTPSEELIESRIKDSLKAIFKEVPFVRLKGWKGQFQARGREFDLILNVAAGREQWRLLIEVKGSGEPRIIRVAVQKLQVFLSDEQKVYGVVAAPYISSRAAEVCKEAGIGFVDLAGNCRLLFGGVFIERLGLPKPKLERRPLRTLFAPKAGRVLRVLLETPKTSWKVQALARAARVSLGLAFKVKERLLDLEYAREEDKRVRLVRPEELLRQWGAIHSYRKSEALDCYGTGDPPELERNLADYCRRRDIQYALALFSGAARVAPFARYSRGFAYVAADIEKVAKTLGWKLVPSGANFTILKPFDDGLLYGAREINGDMVVSDLQLYLDLAGYKGRGEEAGTFILEQRLRPRW